MNLPGTAGNSKHATAFTLAEVVISIAIAAVVFGGTITAYVQTTRRAEWTGYSLSAQALAIQQLEQARSGVWDSSIGKNEVTNLALINPTHPSANVWKGHSWTNLDLPVSGGNFVRATNFVTVTMITNVAGVPAVMLQMVQVDTVWPFKTGGTNRLYTNSISTYLAPDNRDPSTFTDAQHSMNVFSIKPMAAVGKPARQKLAFTLVEMMVTMGIFSMVVIACLYAHMFGLKQDQLVQSKLGASDQSRRGFDLLANDVRSAKIWQIGNGNQSSFTAIADNTAQQGNALQLNLSTNLNVFFRYYFNASEGKLYRMHSPAGSPATVIARNLTNTMYFRAENYRGSVQTNLTHKGVINVRLEFSQYQYPLTLVGTGYYYDYYKMEFRLTSHVPDGS